MSKVNDFFGSLFVGASLSGVVGALVGGLLLAHFGVKPFWLSTLLIGYVALVLLAAHSEMGYRAKKDALQQENDRLRTKADDLHVKCNESLKFISIFVDERGVDVVLAKLREALNAAMEEATTAGRTLYASPITDPDRMIGDIQTLSEHRAMLNQFQFAEREARQLAQKHGFLKEFPEVPRVRDANSLGGGGHRV
jgi:hypothetical protein